MGIFFLETPASGIAKKGIEKLPEVSVVVSPSMIYCASEYVLGFLQ
jgi:hypothetical protein